jgi:formylmethanofuran dehydrogenase subunit B
MTAPWTCPFCPLACDGLNADFALPGSAPCPVATQAWAQSQVLTPGADTTSARPGLASVASVASVASDAANASDESDESLRAVASVDGQPCDLATAVAAAAQLLSRSQLPLIAGLGTDVAATRALYPLACATGAIVDAAESDALMHGLRALQDRGQFTTSLAEVRGRADLLVFVGGLPTKDMPLLRQRLGVGEAGLPQRHVVVLSDRAEDDTTLDSWAHADAGGTTDGATGAAAGAVSVERIALTGDLHNTLALLAACVAGRSAVPVPDALAKLAQRLRGARYAVLIGTPARLPAHGALVVESVHHIVGQLNQSTRAAALWLGGGNGAATANQVHTWLSGLPLRSRAGPRGLEHEPWLFGTQRLLADRAVDALVWVSLFNPQARPPAHGLPMLVLGPPALAAACQRPGAVCIAVASPGIDAPGHVFRTDGSVLMPLSARRSGALPSAAQVLLAITQALAPAVKQDIKEDIREDIREDIKQDINQAETKAATPTRLQTSKTMNPPSAAADPAATHPAGTA